MALAVPHRDTTSACVALVEADHGVDIAQTVARWPVVFLRLPGGQSQFAASTWTASSPNEPVRQAAALLLAEPAVAWTVASLASRVSVSERHLTRVFQATLGVSPAKYLERVRVEAARHLLEATTAGMAQIGAQCGFATAETFRRTFQRAVGVAPSDYRARFATPPTPAAGLMPASVD